MTKAPATTTASCSPTLLFAAKGSTYTFRNVWEGWYNSGYTVKYGDGKRSTYDTLNITRLRFSDSYGRFAEYDLNPKYAGRTLLSIVQGCMGSNRRNDRDDAWKAGRCSNVGKLRASSGSFGKFKVSPVLRIGVGDASNRKKQNYDWALLMPLQGNANGDFDGYNVWAFGGKYETNNGHSGNVTIEATCGMWKQQYTSCGWANR